MKKLLLLISLTVPVYKAFTQCPFTLSLISSGGNCLGSTLNVNTSPGNTLSQIVWYNGSTAIKTVKAVISSSAGVTIAGANGRGPADNQLNNAIGVYVDVSGNVYIVDRLNNRVQKWAPGAVTGVTVAGGNGQGTNANQLSDPIGIFVDPMEDVYVDDFANDRIQEWIPGASSGTTVAGGNGGGPAGNQLYEPVGVFVDGNGNVYVADAGNNRIQEWIPGATSGITVAGGNGAGPGANQLSYPSGVYVDGSGDLYIADEKNNRIQEWVLGATSGITVAGGNGAGPGANQLNTPYSVFVDKNGDIYIADQVNERVQEWVPGATSGITVAGGNGGGSAANQLLNPTDIYVDGNGDIYIADYGNNRIQKWGPQSTIDNSYIPAAAGDYTAIVTNSTGCMTTSNAITMSPAVTPAISISGSATNICTGTSVTFTASPTNGGTMPTWQWQVNGGDTGTNSSTYTTGTLAQGDIVTCLITSNATCASPATVLSNAITITIGPPVTPSVSIAASATTVCQGTPVDFTALPVNGGMTPVFQWQVNGTNTGADSSTYTSSTIATGDIVTCLITSNAGCVTSATAESNPVPVTVNARVASSVSIVSSTAKVCSGMPVSFTATATNGGTMPVYQWQVNGTNAGTDNPNFTSSNLADGDSITCLLSSHSACISAVSNSIPVAVASSPRVDSGQEVSITQGQHATLDPGLSGNIVSYKWSPSAGLSDSTIRDPVASPLQNTIYTLQVVTDEGCQASGNITVKVFAPVRIPNAFTPNGDGRNDIFYVLGGPEGSMIKDFSIFNRWGQRVFQVHDVSSGDPDFGWDGNVNGRKAEAGAYIYSITISFSDGTRQVFQGSLLLIR